MPVAGSPFVTSAVPSSASEPSGGLAQRSRPSGDERAMGVFDVVDLPEHERVVDPGEGRQPHLDAVAG